MSQKNFIFDVFLILYSWFRYFPFLDSSFRYFPFLRFTPSSCLTLFTIFPFYKSQSFCVYIEVMTSSLLSINLTFLQNTSPSFLVVRIYLSYICWLPQRGKEKWISFQSVYVFNKHTSFFCYLRLGISFLIQMNTVNVTK